MTMTTMTTTRQKRLTQQALDIEATAAREAGAHGFQARALAQASIPHRKTPGAEFSRTNGDLTLTLLARSDIGLPYGSIPRLLIAWMATEAARTQSPELVLGESMAEFLEQLGIARSGDWKRIGSDGKAYPVLGSYARVSDQMKRLFSCSIMVTSERGERYDMASGLQPVERATLFFDPKKPDQLALWKSTIQLRPEFFKEVTTSPVSVDMRALRALRASPMELDVYTWATYRMSYLSQPTQIPWEALQAQFGSAYSRPRDFRRYFEKALNAVLVIYPHLRASSSDQGLLLRPSPTHVRKHR